MTGFYYLQCARMQVEAMYFMTRKQGFEKSLHKEKWRLVFQACWIWQVYVIPLKNSGCILRIS